MAHPQTLSPIVGSIHLTAFEMLCNCSVSSNSQRLSPETTGRLNESTDPGTYLRIYIIPTRRLGQLLPLQSLHTTIPRIRHMVTPSSPTRLSPKLEVSLDAVVGCCSRCCFGLKELQPVPSRPDRSRPQQYEAHSAPRRLRFHHLSRELSGWTLVTSKQRGLRRSWTRFLGPFPIIERVVVSCI